MPLGWEPRGRDFPRRNRIVSGLSYGVVVVEAARRSGSLITARFALEQGREVFAVPGSPLDPRAEGTNDLIRSGATLCSAAEHVTAALDPLIRSGEAGTKGDIYREAEAGAYGGETLWDELDLPDLPAAPFVEMPDGEEDDAAPDDRGRILELIGPSPVPVDDLARQTGLPVRHVQMALVELELGGFVERHPGHAVALRPGSGRA